MTDKTLIARVSEAMIRHEQDREGNPFWYDQIADAAIRAMQNPNDTILLAALEQAGDAFESASANTMGPKTREFLLANAELTRAAIAKTRGK